MSGTPSPVFVPSDVRDALGRFAPGNTSSWRPAIDKFCDMVATMQNGCWGWLGRLDRYGYPWFGGGTTYMGHRWSYDHFIGPIPEGLTLDHLCRNRWCVNPTHLEPVTRAENVYRAVGKLTRQQAEEIRDLREAGWKVRVLARHFGVSQTTIHRIVHREALYAA